MRNLVSRLRRSGRSDWLYITIGPFTTLSHIIDQYPDTAGKISQVVSMAGSFCRGREVFPGVKGPIGETNIACDTGATNNVMSHSWSDGLYLAPVDIAGTFSKAMYKSILQSSHPGTKVTIELFKSWSKSARSKPYLSYHPESVTYDPHKESTPMFDACAVMMAAALTDNTLDKYVKIHRLVNLHVGADAMVILSKEDSLKVNQMCMHDDNAIVTSGNVNVALGYSDLVHQKLFFETMASAIARN